jgi:hypothetical protein
MSHAVKGEDLCSKPDSGSRRKPYRKPYRKPEFRFERVFETMALACGKVSPTQKHCQFIRKSS